MAIASLGSRSQRTVVVGVSKSALVVVRAAGRGVFCPCSSWTAKANRRWFGRFVLPNLHQCPHLVGRSDVRAVAVGWADPHPGAHVCGLGLRHQVGL